MVLGLSLLLVVALILVLAWAAKKIKPLSILSSKIKVIAKQDLPFRNQLLLIEVYNVKYLIGINQNSIKKIDRVYDEDDNDNIHYEKFSDYLNKQTQDKHETEL